ncbi:MAG: T9SS type A sorting domain-containing protein [Saprospiraceae bacterium]|nr:T9SS type A sorting domain-containing protein [Saprospiraceae bacterium]
MKKPLLLFLLLLAAIALQAQNSPKPELSVFPNPTTEFVSVQDQADAVGQLNVFNILGKKVKTFEASKGEHYFVGDLPKGVYLVQLVGKNKQVLKSQKVEKR